jgi:hypothetical protein
MRKKKRTVTLIEVLIALGLTAVILSAMMWSYRVVLETGQRADDERRSAFRLGYLQMRLAHVLPLAQQEPFHLGESGLLFRFNNGADLNKELGNDVLARIYLDSQKNLILALMPAKERWDAAPLVKREILYENVDELGFRFFTKEQGWQDHIDKLPAIVEVNLRFKTVHRNYRFPLPNSDEEIVL